MEGQLTNPFEGLERRRLPGMHLNIALEGGVPLDQALGAFFFMMMHDKVEHGCLLKEELRGLEGSVEEGLKAGASPAGEVILAHTSGTMGAMSLVQEEWSYLGDEPVFTFLLMANTSIAQVQYWIFEGVEEPLVPVGLGRALVERPSWSFSMKRGSSRRIESKDHVLRLLEEIERGRRRAAFAHVSTSA